MKIIDVSKEDLDKIEMSDYFIEKSMEEEIDYIIDDYNESKVPYMQETWSIDLNRTIKDKRGNIIGGLKGYLYGWKCLYIELFWVKEEYRKKGCGSQLRGYY